MEFDNNLDLLRSLNKKYEDSNYKDIMESLEKIPDGHPYISLYSAAVLASQITSIEELDQVITGGKTAIDLAWKLFGDSDLFAYMYDYCALNICNALVSRSGYIKKQVLLMAKEEEKRKREALADIQSMAHNLSEQDRRNIIDYVNRTEKDYKNRVEPLEVLADEIHKNKDVLLDYYFQICEEKIFYNPIVERKIKVSIKYCEEYMKKERDVNSTSYRSYDTTRMEFENRKSRYDDVKKKYELKEYWKTHPEEKNKLLNEIEELNSTINSWEQECKNIDDELKVLQVEKSKKTNHELKYAQLDSQIFQEKTRLKELGLFKFKEKKLIREEIEKLSFELAAVHNEAEKERRSLDSKLNNDIDKLNSQKRRTKAKIDDYKRKLEVKEKEVVF